MKKRECGEGIPEGSKVFHHPEVGYLGPCCASEQDAESVLLAGEDTDEDDTDEDDDSDDDEDEDDTDEDDEDEEEPGTPPGTVRVWIDGEDFDEDEIMRTLVVTLRPDDADEDEDEDADEDEDEDADEDADEDEDEDADEDEDEDEDADEDEDEDEDDYYLSRYELVSYLRSHCGDPRWEQDPSEPDVVRVRVPLGLRKTLQDKLLALDCVEDCAEA